MSEGTDQEFHDKLMEYRTVVFAGKIKREMCGKTLDRLTLLQFRSASEPIKLLINSGGGDIDAAIDLCDFMDHVLTVPIHGVVIGECSSAATFVLLSCSVRKATQHSRFVIHSGTTGGVEFKMDKMTPKNLTDLTEEATNTAKMVVGFYAQKLGKSTSEVEKLIERGDQRFNSALTAQEAMEVGLITQIVEGKLDIFPSA